MYLYESEQEYESHQELGQVGGGREGGHITYVAVQLFHNGGNATEGDHNGARVDSLADYENKSGLIIRNQKK